MKDNLCPLRLVNANANFFECVEDKCSLWINDIYAHEPMCSIKKIAIATDHISRLNIEC